MFTKITLRNFRSFDRITLDLCEKNNVAKNLSIIYGENGSGKSNLVSAFVLLNELFQTMQVRDRYEEWLNRTAIFNDEDMEKRIQEQLISSMRDMRAIINDYRMVDCTEPIAVQYEFSIGGNSGLYYVELGEQEIIRERLEYKLNQRRGVYFDCSRNGIIINNAIVKDKDLLSDIKSTAKRFWGKHSILAIITHELDDKSEAYGQENISGNFHDVLYELELVSCNIGIGTRVWECLYAPCRLLSHPVDGRVSIKQEKQIDIAEQIFSNFFSSINSSIKQVVYKKTYSEQYIEYHLHIVRLIAGTYRTIDFTKESKGNHQLLRLLCNLLTACFNGVVIMDEADSAIHDLLFKKIIQEIRQSITGQIIMTTHNTMLMESDLGQGSIYILSEEENGQKGIRCITEYEKRTYLGNNIRNKYLNNEYHGLPTVQKIDFSSLVTKLAEQLNG